MVVCQKTSDAKCMVEFKDAQTSPKSDPLNNQQKISFTPPHERPLPKDTPVDPFSLPKNEICNFEERKSQLYYEKFRLLCEWSNFKNIASVANAFLVNPADSYLYNGPYAHNGLDLSGVHPLCLGDKYLGDPQEAFPSTTAASHPPIKYPTPCSSFPRYPRFYSVNLKRRGIPSKEKLTFSSLNSELPYLLKSRSFSRTHQRLDQHEITYAHRLNEVKKIISQKNLEKEIKDIMVIYKRLENKKDGEKPGLTKYTVNVSDRTELMRLITSIQQARPNTDLHGSKHSIHDSRDPRNFAKDPHRPNLLK